MYRILVVCEADASATAAVAPRFAGLPLLQKPLSWLLFGIYCSYVYIAPLFVWWTAGLHRFPLIAFANVAIYHYLTYRISHRRRNALICAIATLAAFGFFSKCVLLPAYLIAIELCAWKETRVADRRRNWLLLAPLALASVVYVVLWRILQPDYRTAITSDLRYHFKFLEFSWVMLRDSAIGSIWQDANPNDTRTVFASRLASASWIALVGYTVLRAPRSALLWLGLTVLFVLNVLTTSLSKLRADLFGLILPVFLHRYYFELIAVAAVFVALALQKAPASWPRFTRWRERLRQAPCVPWLTATAAATVFALVTWNSYASSTKLIEDFYSRHRQTREFIERLQHDANRVLAEGRPLYVVDEWVSERAGTKGPRTALYLLVAMGIPARAAAPGSGVYRITALGNLVPSN
jgi:hypothetical protein